ncbi:DUF1292 domain-containing protein [Desmospora activa]|uniref:Uncharacterized protein DUF1292 n=1 Tax=Desmospora activa DSM 45169 TaxID=1121389 RepID=A0A2T4ZCK2_9BACL|nr:DUF1292 domain-containing protein [Desmospora activa]PTM59628.1 uncharacterized protein DUF1292 [Desmospora activa DSM 45169]
MNGREEERMAKSLNVLESIWGRELVLGDEEGADTDSRFHLLRELDINGRHYALLRKSEGMDSDAYLFRVTPEGDSHRIVHVEDEYEWEEVADAIDEMLYFGE